MNEVLQIFLIVLLIVQIVLIIRTLRKKKMAMKYASVWILIILLMFIVTIFPNLLFVVSDFFGFETTSNMVFLLGFFFLFYMCFIQTLSLSKQKQEIVTLVQEISILKEEIKNGKKD